MSIKNILCLFLVVIIHVVSSNAIADVKLSIIASSLQNAFFNVDIYANGTDIIAGASVKIQFDNTKLIMKEFETKIESCHNSDIDSANLNGNISLVYLDLSGKGLNLVNSIKMATIKFKSVVKSESETTISTNSVFCDSNLNNITSDNIINEVVVLDKISGMNIALQAPSQANLYPSFFDVKINASGQGIVSGSQIKVNFNNKILRVEKIQPSNGYFASGNLQQINHNSYLTLASIFLSSLDMTCSPMLLSSNPSLATISFSFIDKGKAIINIDDNFSAAYDNEMDSIPITSNFVERTIESIDSIIDFLLEGPEKTQLNEEFLINLNIKALHNEIISGIQTKLLFDNSKLSIVNLTSQSDFSVLSTTIEKANESGFINFAYIDLTGKGKTIRSTSVTNFASITFRSISRGIAKITIDESSSIVSNIFMNEISGNIDELVIKIGTAIIGHVTANIAGYNELIIPNAMIILKGNDKEYSTTTDMNGDFEFVNVAEGNYTIIINAPDLETFTTQIYYDAKDFYFVDIPKLKVACKNDGDINNDQKIGLEEAINALRIVAGETSINKRTLQYKNINQLSVSDGFQTQNSKQNLIEITYLPPCGNRIKNLEGFIDHPQPEKYKIAVYSYYLENWTLKKGFDNQYTFIDSTGKWSCDITKNGYDHNATKVAVFLIPFNEIMSIDYSFESIPSYLLRVAVDYVIMDRKK